MRWIQGGYIHLHYKNQKHELDFQFWLQGAFTWKLGVSSGHRTGEWRCSWALIARSQCYACRGVGWALGGQVGRTGFSLASVFESLRHMEPQKPSVVLLAYWSRVWVSLHVFWTPVSLLHTTWFLRWLLLRELAASWQCLKKPALEGVFGFGLMTPLTFHLRWFPFWSILSTDVGAEIGPHSCPRYWWAWINIFSGHA